MTKYTLHDSQEDAVPDVKIPEYDRKNRFTLEEPSQFKRKTKMALKSFGKGALKSGATIYELARSGVSLAPAGALERAEKLPGIFEKASVLAKELEEKFNLTPPEAESMAERMIQKGFEGSGAGLPFGLGGMVTGFTGGLAGQGARELGLPEGLATAADIGVGAVTPTGYLRKGPQKFVPETPEIAKRAQIIEREGLPKVRGILKEPTKLITPVATPEKLKKFNKKIDEAITANTDRILEESLLGKKLEKSGTYIGDLIESSYKQTLDLARKNPHSIDLTDLSKFAKKSAKKISESAPSLASATEEVVNKLNKYSRDFAPTIEKATVSPVLDQFGRPIITPEKIIPTKLSAEKLTNQWQEINKDLNSLYAKKELTGAEELYRKSLESIKKQLLHEAEKQLKDPELINSFKQQNKIYHEAQKFDKVKSILDPVFEDGFNPNKFKQVFASERKFVDLRKAIGDRNAYRLRDISRYYAQPIEKMKKEFEIKSLLNLEDLLKGAVVKKIVGLPVALALKATPHVYGKLLMSEKTQNLWVNLLRAIKDGSVRGVQKYSDSLEKELNE